MASDSTRSDHTCRVLCAFTNLADARVESRYNSFKVSVHAIALSQKFLDPNKMPLYLLLRCEGQSVVSSPRHISFETKVLTLAGCANHRRIPDTRLTPKFPPHGICISLTHTLCTCLITVRSSKSTDWSHSTAQYNQRVLILS
jgi:hypothetical protein